MRSVGSREYRLRDVLHKLQEMTGRDVPVHVLRYAIEVGAIDPPVKRGGWHCYTRQHLDGMRRYLAERSRLHSAEVKK